MRGTKRWGIVGAVGLVAAIAVAAVGVTAATGAKAAKKPIVIGFAADLSGQMAPFDNPALTAARLEAKKINGLGGVNGAKLEVISCDTQNSKPDVSKSCVDNVVSKGAVVGMVTCDVDFATAAIQEFLSKGLLTIAPCIGTDQMGPKRFGAAGKLAFSFGNVAQDEGSAMAQYAIGRHWKTAALATDTVIVYFKNVIQAFKARFTQLGGKIVDQETYQSLGSTNIQNVVSKFGNLKADVYVTATAGAFGALSTFVSGLRSLGNNTPILNSWAGDGTYWLPKSPKVTNYYFVTYADAFGGDPNPAINKLAKQIHAGTGGFVAGSAAIDGVVTAIRQAGGSTNGATLAAKMEAFHKVPTLSGLVSFSPQLHTVFGRQYRVMEINNNVPRLVAEVVAKVVPKI